MNTIKGQTCSNLGIPESNRVLLSIDGGGIHGTFATSFGYTASIPSHLSNADWVDK